MASPAFAASPARAVFPSDPYSILYRITASPLHSAIEPARLPGLAVRLASAPRRPGEAFERLTVSPAAFSALAAAAEEASVPVDIAATLVAEAGLLLDCLARHRLTGVQALLDRAAGSSRVTRALSAANADYLRALGCRSWRRRVNELDVPARLISRLGERVEERMTRCDLLEGAIRWEVAALLSERSMGNWGSEVVLAGTLP